MATASALSSAKKETLHLVERLDEDVAFEDILYQLCVLETMQRGMKDAEKGRMVVREEAKQRRGPVAEGGGMHGALDVHQVNRAPGAS